MAIDFSQVKTITIPEGSVTKITDSNGNILWQGVQSEGWHTIWEGNKTCSVTKSGTNTPVFSGEVPNLAHTAPGTGYKPKIRITFSYSNTNTDYNNWKDKFIVNGTNPTTISSPLTIEAVGDLSFFKTYNICIILCASTDNKVNLGVGLQKKRDETNNSVIFSLGKQTYAASGSNINSYNGNFTITFTVTKIEQYY